MSLLAVCNVHTAGTITSETAWYVCQRAGLLLPHYHSIHIYLPEWTTHNPTPNPKGVNECEWTHGQQRCLCKRLSVWPDGQTTGLRETINRSAAAHNHYYDDDEVITVASSLVNNQFSVTLVWYTCNTWYTCMVHMQYLLKHLRLHV